MNEDPMITALVNSAEPFARELIDDARQFLRAIDTVSGAKPEEAVPAEMMQMFTDEQWCELLFEFQSGTTLFTSEYDIAGLHQTWMESGELVSMEESDRLYWILFVDSAGLIVRMLNLQEFRAMEMAANGQPFAAMATALWPDLPEDQAHHEMTEMLLVWLNDGLIIDAGVPLPEDAEFETGDQ